MFMTLTSFYSAHKDTDFQACWLYFLLVISGIKIGLPFQPQLQTIVWGLLFFACLQ